MGLSKGFEETCYLGPCI